MTEPTRKTSSGSKKTKRNPDKNVPGTNNYACGKCGFSSPHGTDCPWCADAVRNKAEKFTYSTSSKVFFEGIDKMVKDTVAGAFDGLDDFKGAFDNLSKNIPTFNVEIFSQTNPGSTDKVIRFKATDTKTGKVYEAVSGDKSMTKLLAEKELLQQERDAWKKSFEEVSNKQPVRSVPPPDHLTWLAKKPGMAIGIAAIAGLLFTIMMIVADHC